MDAAAFQESTHVSRETLELYKEWENLLNHWNKKINLVSRTTIDTFWHRHALDCQQLCTYLPANTKTVLDMGAGAGFPGLALAIHLRGNTDAQVTLVEANGKKVNFLRSAVLHLGVQAEIVHSRIEALPPRSYNVITARALAALPMLLKLSRPFWHESTVGIFPKGESWQNELEAAQRLYGFNAMPRRSITDDMARILVLTRLHDMNMETA